MPMKATIYARVYNVLFYSSSCHRWHQWIISRIIIWATGIHPFRNTHLIFSIFILRHILWPHPVGTIPTKSSHMPMAIFEKNWSQTIIMSAYEHLWNELDVRFVLVLILRIMIAVPCHHQEINLNQKLPNRPYQIASIPPFF